MIVAIIGIAVAVLLLLLGGALYTPQITASGISGSKSVKDITDSLVVLSQKCKAVSSGTGLKLFKARKSLYSAYKILKHKNTELLDFEREFYDNFYLIIRALDRQSGVVSSYSKLPHCFSVPRVYLFCREIVFSSCAMLDEEELKHYFDVISEEVDLTYAELEAVPNITEYCLVEFAVGIARKILRINELIERGQYDLKRGKVSYSMLPYVSYVYGLYERASIEKQCEIKALECDNGKSVSARLDSFYALIGFYAKTVSCLIKSLRAPRFVNFAINTSRVNKIFEESDCFYSDCSDDTKAEYLSLVGDIAARKKTTECAVARNAIDKASDEGIDLYTALKREPLRSSIALIYFGSIITLALTSIGLGFLKNPVAIAVPFVVFPIFIVALRRVYSFAFGRRVFLPRVKTSDAPALVTVCALASSKEEVNELFKKLAALMRLNPESNLCYSLLLDLPPSSTERSERDDEIIACIERAYMNTEGNSRVIALLRNRSESEGKFCGYERKRGALLQLDELILFGRKDNFALIKGELRDFKYVITLDSDCMISAAQTLVRILEHPANIRTNVVSLSFSASPAKIETRFSDFFSGDIGLTPYSSAAFDDEFGLFGLGNFTGKGIYRVREFYNSVADAFPDNRILSHDFIEGAFAGTAVSEVVGLDEFPRNFSAFTARRLRWIRGDLQLLKYLLPRVKNKTGERVKNPLPVVAKFHILFNALIGLYPVFSTATIVLAFFYSPYLLLAAFALNLVNIVFAIICAATSRNATALKNIAIELFEVCMMPTIAAYTLFAAAVTAVRLIRGKRLLEWRTSAHYNGIIHTFYNVLFAAILAALQIPFGFSVTFTIFAAIFAFAPVIELFTAMQLSSGKAEYNAKPLALKVWKYFESTLTEDNNFLPCDNYREDTDAYAYRTSPTNISFALTAVLCAHRFGFIDESKKNFYLENIIAAIEKQEKYRGHLYNWIDVKTAQPLSPKYVSAVDSGNLLSGLMLCKADTGGELRFRVCSLIEAMDFGFLTDEKSRLLHIGYNTETKERDVGCYDLCGSEALLTYLMAATTGKTDTRAFYALSRECVKAQGSTLYSWSGGLFEYLMCGLFTRYPRKSLFDLSSRNAVKAHISYANVHSEPFYGVSEGQYASLNDIGDFKYAASGVPSISLSNATNPTACMPYAGVLSLNYLPKKAVKNFEKMRLSNMEGSFGFYESWDEKPIKSFMAHHEGMTLCALTNYAFDDYLCELLLSQPEGVAAEYLLSERPSGKARRKREFSSKEVIEANGEVITEHLSRPKIFAESTGVTALICDSDGGVRLTHDRHSVYSYDERGGGMQIYACEIGSNEKPRRICEFSDKAIYRDVYENYVTETIANLLDGGGVSRTFRLKNTSNTTKRFRVRTYGEVNLLLPRDDVHRAFSDMKVETFMLGGAVVAHRINGLYLAHAIVYDGVKYETSKHNYFGRGHMPSFGRSLAPVLSGEVTVSLGAGESIILNIFDFVERDRARIEKRIADCKNPNFAERSRLTDKRNNLYGALRDICAAVLYEKEFGVVFPPLDSSVPTLVYNVRGRGDERLKRELTEAVKLSRYVRFNLAVIYDETYGYYRNVHDEIMRAVYVTGFEREFRGHYVIYNKREREEDCAALERIAFVPKSVKVLKEIPVSPPKYKNAKLPSTPLSFSTALGGFTERSGYFVNLTEKNTPSPWSNIIADENFGTLITERGGGYTYFMNSRERKLTAFKGDSVRDEVSELVAVGEGDCVTLLTGGEGDYSRTVTHGLGYSEFTCNRNGLICVLREYIAVHANTKFFVVDIYNGVTKPRTLDVLFAVKPENKPPFTFKRNERGVSVTGGNGEFYLMSSHTVSSRAYYQEAFSRGGETVTARRLSNEGVTPFPSLSVSVPVPASGSATIAFTLGVNKDINPSLFETYFTACKDYFSSLSRISVKSTDKPLEMLMARLPYQVLCSRFNARLGFYQQGGAIGFRDQLQDCVALKYVYPGKVREHIFECCARQFERGDVLHWWHPPYTGVRTHICDDRLFLPYIVADFIEYTGDSSVLAERIPFLKDVALPSDVEAVYVVNEPSEKKASVLAHCMRAIDSCEFGENGLLLMGGGDWNDGMNEVGARGIGTTVWGSMFLYLVINKFLPFVTDDGKHKEYEALSALILNALYKTWDGDRYVRAYTDDGIVLGSVDSEECKIDLLSQSFAAISGASDPERTYTALYTAKEKLWDKRNKIVKLLDPPFEKTENVGYIADYPRGVRENGGQYTHAAVWFAKALLLRHDADGYRVLSDLNPINHCMTVEDLERYSGEPYALSGDVYAGEYVGRSGWSQYTGAAAWYYQTVIENLLGIKIRGNKISVNPNLPPDCADFKVTIRCAFGDVTFDVEGKGKGKFIMKRGKVCYNDTRFTLTPDNANGIVITRNVDIEK